MQVSIVFKSLMSSKFQKRGINANSFNVQDKIPIFTHAFKDGITKSTYQSTQVRNYNIDISLMKEILNKDILTWDFQESW